jgi:hypothetical protein
VPKGVIKTLNDNNAIVIGMFNDRTKRLDENAFRGRDTHYSVHFVCSDRMICMYPLTSFVFAFYKKTSKLTVEGEKEIKKFIFDQVVSMNDVHDHYKQLSPANQAQNKLDIVAKLNIALVNGSFILNVSDLSFTLVEVERLLVETHNAPDNGPWMTTR